MQHQERNTWTARAYDMTWSTTHFGEHATTVDGNGRDPGEKELMAVGKMTGIPARLCRQIAEGIRNKTESIEKKSRGTRSQQLPLHEAKVPHAGVLFF